MAFDQLSVEVRREINTSVKINPENLLKILEIISKPDIGPVGLKSLHDQLAANDLVSENVKTALSAVNRLVKKKNVPSRGSFNWVDSELIEAIKYGDWIVLDNTNQSSDALLDRLNSLLEPGGFLAVNERGNIDGEVMTLRPHPEFRLFLLVDPAFGELSRPLRNRGIEIFVKTLNLSNSTDLDELLIRLNRYTSNPEISRRILFELTEFSSDKRFICYCIAGAKKFRNLTLLGISTETALTEAIRFVSSTLVQSESTVDLNRSFPVILPPSASLISSPVHFEAADILSRIISWQRTQDKNFPATAVWKVAVENMANKGGESVKILQNMLKDQTVSKKLSSNTSGMDYRVQIRSN